MSSQRALRRRQRDDAIDFLHRVLMDEGEPWDARQRAATNLLQQLTAQERTEKGITGHAERVQERARRHRYA